MDLVLYFSRFRSLLYESEYILKFLLASCLKTRRVMKDEVWVALEGKLIMDIVDPSLRHQSQRPDSKNVQRSHLRGWVNLLARGR
jgi:hypothetical protein